MGTKAEGPGSTGRERRDQEGEHGWVGRVLERGRVALVGGVGREDVVRKPVDEELRSHHDEAAAVDLISTIEMSGRCERSGVKRSGVNGSWLKSCGGITMNRHP